MAKQSDSNRGALRRSSRLVEKTKAKAEQLTRVLTPTPRKKTGKAPKQNTKFPRIQKPAVARSVRKGNITVAKQKKSKQASDRGKAAKAGRASSASPSRKNSAKPPAPTSGSKITNAAGARTGPKSLMGQCHIPSSTHTGDKKQEQKPKSTKTSPKKPMGRASSAHSEQQCSNRERSSTRDATAGSYSRSASKSPSKVRSRASSANSKAGNQSRSGHASKTDAKSPARSRSRGASKVSPAAHAGAKPRGVSKARSKNPSKQRSASEKRSKSPSGPRSSSKSPGRSPSKVRSRAVSEKPVVKGVAESIERVASEVLSTASSYMASAIGSLPLAKLTPTPEIKKQRTSASPGRH